MFYGPVCIRVRPFWKLKCYGLDCNLSWWSHSAQNGSKNIECRKMHRRYAWSYRSALSTTAKLWSRLSTMQDGTWLVFVKTFWTRITSVFFLGWHYHRICNKFNIYGMNSVDVLAIVSIHQKKTTNKMMKLLQTVVQSNCTTRCQTTVLDYPLLLN